MNAGLDARSTLAVAAPVSAWLDDAAAPAPAAALTDDISCDLLVVGGGFTGLWTSLKAKERAPGREVVLIEGDLIGSAASGRNGGFVASSLTHGIPNGHSRWPDEMDMLERLGLANLDGMEQDLATYDIPCSFERTGKITVATEPYQLDELADLRDLSHRYGRKIHPLSATEVRERVDSPTFLGGNWDPDGTALVNPAQLAWGLRAACLRLGVRIFERTPGETLAEVGSRVRVGTPFGSVVAGQVVLATNVFPSLLRRLRLYTVPVYDHVLVTEPLTAPQLASLGWDGREGLTDAGTQFHYFRLTPDNRVLWGGYDAIYRYGSSIDARHDQGASSFRKLAEHFATTFPQLEGIRFSHSWSGLIDTCTRFCAFYGLAMKGRVGYALGYTGLGVGATRFGAEVVLDLLEGGRTERTSLQMVRSRPLPFPPEPVRSIGIHLTQHSLAKADRRKGRRDLWLRTLDRLGVGFDS